MAYIAVDMDESEWVFTYRPSRNLTTQKFVNKVVSGMYVQVPKGTSLKLTGKQLSWSNEPLELK